MTIWQAKHTHGEKIQDGIVDYGNGNHHHNSYGLMVEHTHHVTNHEDEVDGDVHFVNHAHDFGEGIPKEDAGE